MRYMKEILKKNRNWVIVYLSIGLFNAFMANYKANCFQRIVDGLSDRTISIFGILFFLFVVLAAITSAIALTEVLVTFIIDARIAKGKAPKRNTVVALVCLVIFIEAAVVAADGLGSNGMWVPFQSTGLDLGSCWLEFMDFVSEGIAMPLGALIMSISLAG